MLLHYQAPSFPSYEKADEQGMPQPCALGVPWVNEDTQRTLARLTIPRTDPWGKPLPPDKQGQARGIQDDPPAGDRDGLLAEQPKRSG